MKRYLTLEIDSPCDCGIVVNEGTLELPKLKLIARATETFAQAIVDRLNEAATSRLGTPGPSGN